MNAGDVMIMVALGYMIAFVIVIQLSHSWFKNQER